MAHPAHFELQNLTKSFHEALILSSLASGPRHGYQLALDIEARSERAFRFRHGTLYPILHKLEKDGLLEGSWDEIGRRRKRYAITDKGRRHLEAQRAAWEGFSARFLGLLRRADG
jgi:DNA-binding PadR family transcriptional regulator